MERNICMENEKEVVSKNFIEMEIEKDLAEACTTRYVHVSHRNQMVIYILVMQNLFCSTMDWQKNTMGNSICVLMIPIQQRNVKNS